MEADINAKNFLVSSRYGQTLLYDSVCQLLKLKLPCVVLKYWMQLSLDQKVSKTASGWAAHSKVSL